MMYVSASLLSVDPAEPANHNAQNPACIANCWVFLTSRQHLHLFMMDRIKDLAFMLRLALLACGWNERFYFNSSRLVE